MIDNLQTIYPVSPLLKDHIYCYYTIDTTPAHFKSKHYSFPHTYNALSIYNSAAFDKDSNDLRVKGNSNNTPLCILQGKRQGPLLVDLEGSFSRLTILFKPLGLNYFIDKAQGKILTSNPSRFNHWDGEAFNNMLNQFFTGSDIYKNLHHFEAFLCNIYRPLELNPLQQALTLLSDFEHELPIEEIAHTVGLPLRTFNRLFKLYMGVSPVTHQRVARFRHSLENKLFDHKLKKLTEIGYQSNFYDQSYFIKLYNQLSGSNPKTLFNTVERVGDSKLVFQFRNVSFGWKIQFGRSIFLVFCGYRISWIWKKHSH